MTSPELENLVRTGKLKRELLATGEIDGLRRSGEARLADARGWTCRSRIASTLLTTRRTFSPLLRYAAWAIDSENRYLVFQTLPHTLGIPASTWRVLAKAHEKRNLLSLPNRSIYLKLMADGVVSAVLRETALPVDCLRMR